MTWHGTTIGQYTYDANGNATSKTDARGIVTTYGGYDALNRPYSKSYTLQSDGSPEGTPAVTYSYDLDLKGALSSSSAGANSTSDMHGKLGRISGSTQVTAGVWNPFSYQYSLADRLSQMQYPSGRIVKYVPDSTGRVQYVRNGATQANYATLSYTGLGGIATMAMANGITEQLTWNDRSQITAMNAGGAPTLNFYSRRAATSGLASSAFQ